MPPLSLCITIGAIRLIQKEIYADLVIVCQGHQKFICPLLRPRLHIAIFTLCNP